MAASVVPKIMRDGEITILDGAAATYTVSYEDGDFSFGKDKDARIAVYTRVKDIVFDPDRRSASTAARKLLNPWTVAIEYLGGDVVPASHVFPVMYALVDEYKSMQRLGVLPPAVMKDVHWTEVMQILKVRVEGGAAHGEARKVGLLLPHHLVAKLLNPYFKPPAKVAGQGDVVRRAQRACASMFTCSCRVRAIFSVSCAVGCQPCLVPAGGISRGSELCFQPAVRERRREDAARSRPVHEVLGRSRAFRRDYQKVPW